MFYSLSNFAKKCRIFVIKLEIGLLMHSKAGIYIKFRYAKFTKSQLIGPSVIDPSVMVKRSCNSDF